MNAAFPNGTCKSDIDHTNISMQELHTMIRSFWQVKNKRPRNKQQHSRLTTKLPSFMLFINCKTKDCYIVRTNPSDKFQLDASCGLARA